MKSFNHIMGDSKDLSQRFEKIKKDVINDPDVKMFLETHQSEVTNTMIDEDLNILQEYKVQENHYDCHVSKDCTILVKVHVPKLYVGNHHITIRYLPSPCTIKHDDEKLDEHLIASHNTQRHTLNT